MRYPIRSNKTSLSTKKSSPASHHVGFTTPITSSRSRQMRTPRKTPTKASRRSACPNSSPSSKTPQALSDSSGNPNFNRNSSLVILNLDEESVRLQSRDLKADPENTPNYIQVVIPFLSDPAILKACEYRPFVFSFCLPGESDPTDAVNKLTSEMKRAQNLMKQHIEGSRRIAVVLDARCDETEGGIIYRDDGQAPLSDVIEEVFTKEIREELNKAEESLLVMIVGGSYLQASFKTFETFIQNCPFSHVIGFMPKSFDVSDVTPWLKTELHEFMEGASSEAFQQSIHHSLLSDSRRHISLEIGVYHFIRGNISALTYPNDQDRARFEMSRLPNGTIIFYPRQTGLEEMVRRCCV